jgi:hypothetical protein
VPLPEDIAGGFDGAGAAGDAGGAGRSRRRQRQVGTPHPDHAQGMGPTPSPSGHRIVAMPTCRDGLPGTTTNGPIPASQRERQFRHSPEQPDESSQLTSAPPESFRQRQPTSPGPCASLRLGRPGNFGGNPWAQVRPSRLSDYTAGGRVIAGDTSKPLELLVPRGGIEPPTRGFSVRCSTN